MVQVFCVIRDSPKENIFFKYEKYDLKTQIATRTNQDNSNHLTQKNKTKSHDDSQNLVKHTLSQYRQRKT